MFLSSADETVQVCDPIAAHHKVTLLEYQVWGVPLVAGAPETQVLWVRCDELNQNGRIATSGQAVNGTPILVDDATTRHEYEHPPRVAGLSTRDVNRLRFRVYKDDNTTATFSKLYLRLRLHGATPYEQALPHGRANEFYESGLAGFNREF